MNIVCCKIVQCPFNREEFCTNSVIAIEPDGHCSILWRKGAPQPLSDALNKGNKIDLIVEEGEFRDAECTFDEPIGNECDESGKVSEHSGEESNNGGETTGTQSTDGPASNRTECGAIEALRNAHKESAGAGNDEPGVKETDGTDTTNVKQE